MGCVDKGSKKRWPRMDMKDLFKNRNGYEAKGKNTVAYYYLFILSELILSKCLPSKLSHLTVCYSFNFGNPD